MTSETCAFADCPRDATGCNRCLDAENAALLSSLREARAQVATLTETIAARDEHIAVLVSLGEIAADRITDLEARAIPPEWTARFPSYEINAWGSDDREKARVRVVGAASPVLTTWENDLPNDSVHLTVSDALAAAAAKERP